MTTPLALLLTALLLATTVDGASAQSLAQLLEGITGRIEQFDAFKGKKLAVGEFPLTDGRATELSIHLADQLEAALASRVVSGRFEVVARNQLCQVIRENKLWVNDQFDPALHKKLGRLSHADVLATGRITDQGRELLISLRFLDTETGRALWGNSLTVAASDALKALLSRPLVGDGCGGAPPATAPVVPPVASPAGPAPTAAETLKVKVWADRPSYRIGDSIQFGLRVNRDAYVTLINIGTSGDVTVIYPNRFHSSHFVRAGQDVTIPPRDAGFTLSVQAPPGFDQVRAIATTEPVSVHRGNFAAQGATFRSLDRVQTRGLSVEIREERQKADPSTWAEDVVVVEVGR